MKNLLNQIRDNVRNSFDRFLCSLPVIGDALRLVRILYQLVQEQKTIIVNLQEQVDAGTGENVTDLIGEPVTIAVLYELVRELYGRIEQRSDDVREELHGRMDAVAEARRMAAFARLEQIQQDRITDSAAIRKELNARINRCSLARADQDAFDEIVRRLNALETVPTVEPTVEEMQADFEIWKENCCSPCN